MRSAEALLFAANLGQGVYGRWRIQRILAALFAVAVMAISAAVMLSVLMIGGMYAAYLFLLSAGFLPILALCMTGTFTVFIILTIMAAAQQRMKKLRSTLRTPAGEVVDAFLDGLLSN